MAGADDTDEDVVVERLGAQLGAVAGNDADVEVDRAVAQKADVLVGLGGEAQAHAGRRRRDRSAQPRRMTQHEGLVGAQGEVAPERLDIDQGRRAQHGAHLAVQGPHLLGYGKGVGCGHHGAAGRHQDRIPQDLAQPRQGAAHRRGGKAQASRRRRDAAFVEQGVERGQEIKVEARHDVLSKEGRYAQ